MTHTQNQPPEPEFNAMVTDPMTRYYVKLGMVEEPPVEEWQFAVDVSPEEMVKRALEQERVAQFNIDEMESYLAAKYGSTKAEARLALVATAIDVTQKMVGADQWPEHYDGPNQIR
jgi:hypothetical protein